MEYAALIAMAAGGLLAALLLIPLTVAVQKSNRYAENICTTSRFEETLWLVRIYVFAAEQIFGKGKGSEKLAYVKKALAKEGITADDANEHDRVRALIEAAVCELKYLEQD